MKRCPVQAFGCAGRVWRSDQEERKQTSSNIELKIHLQFSLQTLEKKHRCSLIGLRGFGEGSILLHARKVVLDGHCCFCGLSF